MRLPVLALLLIPAAVTFADDEATKPAAVDTSDDYHEGELTLGLSQKDVSTVSSKFEEYRDVPNGVSVPSFRFAGRSGGWRYAFGGERVRQQNESYAMRLWNGGFEIVGDYRQIPHRFGNDGHTIYTKIAPGVWAVSDTLQQSLQGAIAAVPQSAVNYAFLSRLLAPSLASAGSVDLALERQRGNLAMNFEPTHGLGVSVSYFHERRTGDRAASGTSFGFNNVVELPEALHYLTQDVGADGEYQAKWGSVRAGIHYNWFENQIDTFSFDNVFRATASTDHSAYLAPSSSSINGPNHGLTALPPDNDALTGSLGATFKLPARSRLSVSASRSRWEQNKTPFIPYSTNTAITEVDATNPAVLPAQALAGKVDVTSFSANFNSHLADHLGLNLRYRYYDQDNQTPRLTFPGYVPFDAYWNTTPRIGEPYGFTNDRFDGGLDYSFGRLTLEAGYRWVKMDRTYRETEATTEGTFVSAADLHLVDGLLVRASYEHGSRDYEGYEAERSEDASFVTPGTPTNLFALPGNLRFDQAPRKTDRVLATLQYSPGDKWSLAGTYGRQHDDYDQSQFGLIDASFDTLTLEADFQPTERVNLNAYWTWEKLVNFQRGRQSGSTVSTNPRDDWTSDVNDKTQSVGGGADVTLKPEHWFFSFTGWYQKVNGDNALFAAPGGAPANARPGGVQSLPLYDDTRIVSVNAELRDEFAKHWSAAIGAWYENYTIDDSNTQGLSNYAPGSLFLAANDGDYRAWVGYVRVVTRF